MKEALLALKNNFSDLLTTDNRAIGSYNIIASGCEEALLPRIQKAPTRVDEELKQIQSSDDAKAALQALNEAEKPSASQKQGWGSWFWNQLPGFLKAVVNRVMGWSNEEKQQFRERLQEKIDAAKQI